jgi:predicted dehydrogenase
VNVYQREIEDLARAIRGGAPPMLAPDEGLRNARVIDALLTSARDTAVITIEN